MKKSILLFILFFSLSTFAQNKSKQIEFTYANQKITGTLKNSFRNLIYEIEVKVDNQDVQKFRIEKMNDITIDNEAYVSSLNNIDINLSTNPNNLNNEANPNYKKEWILLKFLVKGDYNLYSYELSNFTQFYFSSPTSKQIEPLIYKEYFINHRTTKANNQFQNQLYKDAPQPELGFLEYKKIEYKKDKLIKYFNKLNNYDLEKGITKTKFNFSIFGGVVLNKFDSNKIGRNTPQEALLYIIGYSENYYIKSTENYTSPTIGVAVEIPFSNKNQSAVFADASLSIYNQKFQIDRQYTENHPLGYSNINYELKSKVVLINAGYKHYFKIVENFEIYGEGGITLTNFINSKNIATWETENGKRSDSGFKSSTNFGGMLGVGLKFNNHYYVSARFKKPLETGNTMQIFTLGYTF